MTSTRIHLTFVLEESTVPHLAAARHRWDPLMASGVPPHITLVYPEEYTDERSLVERAEDAASEFGPFTMQTERIITDGDNGRGGVFTSLVVPTDAWAGLREAILRPPFDPIEVATASHLGSPSNVAPGHRGLVGTTRCPYRQQLRCA